MAMSSFNMGRERGRSTDFDSRLIHVNTANRYEPDG
jgi:hypothetical protein